MTESRALNIEKLNARSRKTAENIDENNYAANENEMKLEQTKCPTEQSTYHHIDQSTDRTIGFFNFSKNWLALKRKKNGKLSVGKFIELKLGT